MTTVAKHEMDLTTGSILKKLIRFAIPIILMNMLQMLFNVTDVAILGMLVGDMEVGAVGATTALISLIVNLFIGFSVGTNVVLAKCVGSRDGEKANRVVGTSVVMSVIIGICLTFVGFFGAKTFLTWMGCDPLLLDKATLYLKIYFLGMPIIMLYNFMAAVMRAVGDTVRPMIFLFIAGVVNVGLNVFFILAFNMDVDGVAIATVVSQAISATLAIIVAIKSKGYGRLKLSCLKIHKKEFFEILKIGLPSGLQSSMFAISNVLIQTTVNSFGAVGTTGNAVAQQFDGFVWQVGNSMSLGCMSFVSQNYGAGRMDRVKQVLIRAVIVAAIFSFSLGGLFVLLCNPLCRIMTSDPAVIEIARQRLTLLGLTYFICAIMDVLNNSLRALGKSVTAMIISLCFVCIFRIVWLNSFYLLNPVFTMIYWSYPISWIMSIAVVLIFLLSAIKKAQLKINNKTQIAQTEISTEEDQAEAV